MKIFALLALLPLVPTLASATQVDGTYEMDVQIGDRAFTDIVILKQDPVTRALTGSVTLPGVFTAPLTGSIHGTTMNWSDYSDRIEFSIAAQERSHEIRVRYAGKVDSSTAEGILFTGEAVDLISGEVFGTFSAFPLQPAKP